MLKKTKQNTDPELTKWRNWQEYFDEALKYYALSIYMNKPTERKGSMWHEYEEPFDTYDGPHYLPYEEGRRYRIIPSFGRSFYSISSPINYANYVYESIANEIGDGYKTISNMADLCLTYENNGMKNVMDMVWGFFHTCPNLENVLKKFPNDPEAVAAYSIYHAISTDAYPRFAEMIMLEKLQNLASYTGKKDEPMNQCASTDNLCTMFSEVFSFMNQRPDKHDTQWRTDDFNKLAHRLFCYRVWWLLSTAKAAMVDEIGISPDFLYNILWDARMFEIKMSGDDCRCLPQPGDGSGDPRATWRFCRVPSVNDKIDRNDNGKKIYNLKNLSYVFTSRCLSFKITFRLKASEDGSCVSGKDQVKAEIEEGAYGQGELRKYTQKFNTFAEALEFLGNKVVSDDAFSDTIKLDEI